MGDGLNHQLCSRSYPVAMPDLRETNVGLADKRISATLDRARVLREASFDLWLGLLAAEGWLNPGNGVDWARTTATGASGTMLISGRMPVQQSCWQPPSSLAICTDGRLVAHSEPCWALPCWSDASVQTVRSEINIVPLVLRSSKVVHETTSEATLGSRWTSPDPRSRSRVQVGGGNRSSLVELGRVDEALAGKRFLAEQPPPAFLEVQPAGANRDEHLLDAGMSGDPLLDRRALVAGEVVGDQEEVSRGVGLVDGLEQLEVTHGVTRAVLESQVLTVADAQGAIDPDLLGTPTVVERGLDPMTIGRPARNRRVAPGDERAQLIEAEDRPVQRGLGVERDGPDSFGANSGSPLSAQL